MRHCRPVDRLVSPSWLSPSCCVAQLTFAYGSWFVAQMTADALSFGSVDTQ